jgi:S-DNA-T family DNA segregation ATPase FtsK/SpoIIIE
LLLVDGVEPLMAQLDDADPARGSAAFLRLVRDGAAAGLTCVLTADRAVPGGRLAGAVRERLVLALPDRADYAVAGIRPAAVPENRPPGRALVGEDALEAQLVLPPPLPEATALGPARPGGPLRIGELPADPALAATPDGPRLRIGPGGDEGHPLTVDLARSGGLLVVGPPGSGRSSALDAFTVDLSGAGMAVLRVGHRSPADLPPGTGWLRPDDLGGLGSWLEGLRGATAVVVADDVGTVAEWPVLSSLPGGGRAGEVLVVASGTAGELAGHYQGAVAALRRGRTGLLLCPGPADADLLGVRLPRTPVPVRPGSGWLVSSGGPVRVQVARRRSAQSSSSRGPISCVAYQASS